MTRRDRIVAVITAIVLVVAAGALVFGPARGAREDIGHVRTELQSSRKGIYGTLAASRASLTRTTQLLDTTEKSLVIQQQGLTIAAESRDVTKVTSQRTAEILHQTSATLDTVRRVVAALGPLQQLQGKIDDVVRGVNKGVALAQSTLTLARQTLSTGKAALAVAVETLTTLRQSRDIQRQLLEVGRQTLEQTREINRKLPVPAVFPTSTTGR